ncbi:hypothetical protein GCM10009756_09590 [Pseudokineococcus marinus]
MKQAPVRGVRCRPRERTGIEVGAAVRASSSTVASGGCAASGSGWADDGRPTSVRSRPGGDKGRAAGVVDG